MATRNLDPAEVDFFKTHGLTPKRASALRTELDWIGVVSVKTGIDAAIAEKFWATGLLDDAQLKNE